jgi:hypothetical protein
LNTSKRHNLIWISIIFLIIVLISLAGWILVKRVPSLTQQFPQNDIHSSLIILSPGDQSKYPADASVPILVTASTEDPIASFELWVNGQLVSTHQPDGPERNHYTHTFYWTPAVEQNARILARSVSSQGSTITSNPIRIKVSAPAGLRILSRDGAEDPQSQIIYPLSVTENAFPAVSEPPLEAAPLSPAAEPISTDLNLWLGQRFSSNTPSPLAPELQSSVVNCSVTLTITDRADNELGYLVYRSAPGSSAFERIAELGSINLGVSVSYTDPDLAAESIYYASAFNGAGESPSAPVLVNLSSTGCAEANGTADPDELAQEDLEILDLAYMYYAFNGAGYQRYPHDPDSFLTPSEYPTSLPALIKGLTSSVGFPVSYANVVVWGWNGGSLLNLGSYHLEIEESRLRVCNLGTGCTGDVASGFQAAYGELANDAEDQNREFYWSTAATGTTAILWQISTAPFSGDFSPHPYGLVGAGCSDGLLQGSFLVDFQALADYLPAPASCGGLSQAWIDYSKFALNTSLFPGSEIRYYIRFTPMAGNQPAGKPSNTVEILAKPGESFIEPVIVDHLPEIYEVEIVDFVPIKNMDIKFWGCVFITGLDYDEIWNYYRSSHPATISDSLIDKIATKIYDSLNYAVQNNLIVCPAPYSGSSDSGSVLSDWGSMFMEGLSEFWDTVVSAFNALKAGIVDVAAAAINGLGIPCNSECKAGLKLGLEIGMAYFTGIPPNLPSFTELKNQGIEYAIELAAAEAGIPCPEECQKVLREGLEEVVDMVAENNTQPGCVDESWANLLGKHNLCLPPGVDAEAVPEGVSEPARAAVRITRIGQENPGQFKYGDQAAYVVNVQFTAENTLLAGQTIPYIYSYWGGSSNYKEFFTVEAPITRLNNNVFDSQSLPIPPLGAGESITIPLSLTPHQYYIPEHLHSLMMELNSRDLDPADVGGIGGTRGALYDWLCLYKGGLIKIEADVACLSTPAALIGQAVPDETSQLVPCGSTAQPIFFQETSDACYP